MKEIPITQGMVALVDDELEPILNKWKWFYSSGYALRGTRNFDTYYNVFMHQMVANIKFGIIPEGYFIDHINGNRLDNTWNNIRLATNQQNCFNKKKIAGFTSRYKGVHWNKWHKKWAASIRKGDIHKHLGYFQTEELAAKCYDEAAREYHGEFANLNFK